MREKGEGGDDNFHHADYANDYDNDDDDDDDISEPYYSSSLFFPKTFIENRLSRKDNW